ncbi:MAG: hypothetical protein OEZ01_03745 [Candidatus Heimdallarchaeota archaeon]|nr:hypothetical protein [Candidatus Heimdallarchaeota archaeon]MDH5645092.1 hypothetical protein [Candidatus Heimdallarchaeota archaeon]
MKDDYLIDASFDANADHYIQLKQYVVIFLAGYRKIVRSTFDHIEEAENKISIYMKYQKLYSRSDFLICTKYDLLGMTGVEYLWSIE